MLRERGYRQVSLPIALVEKIEEFLGKNADLGYTSVPEFIRQAIRDKLNNNVK